MVLVDSELHEITLEVCKSIGIDSNEPAEWIGYMKELDSLTVIGCPERINIQLRNLNAELNQQIEQLQAELKQLKGE